MTEPRAGTPRDTLAYRAGSVLAGLEGLVLLGFSGFYGYELASGATDDLTRGATSGVLILVFGVFLLFLSRAWARRSDWPRTPTLLWNALLLPVAWSLVQSDRALVAVGVAAVAVASIVAALGARPHDPIRRAGDGEQDDQVEDVPGTFS